MNLIYAIQVLKSTIVLYLFFISIYYILSLYTLYKSPFYYNDKNKTIHPFDIQSLKSQLRTASWVDRVTLTPLDGAREQRAGFRRGLSRRGDGFCTLLVILTVRIHHNGVALTLSALSWSHHLIDQSLCAKFGVRTSGSGRKKMVPSLDLKGFRSNIFRGEAINGGIQTLLISKHCLLEEKRESTEIETIRFHKANESINRTLILKNCSKESLEGTLGRISWIKSPDFTGE